MSFKVQVGPPQIAIHQGQTVLVSEPDGYINWPSEKGLYFLDTRIISNWAIYANGEPWELLNGGRRACQGQTPPFEVTKGDPELVERCDIASKAAQLRVASDLI